MLGTAELDRIHKGVRKVAPSALALFRTLMFKVAAITAGFNIGGLRGDRTAKQSVFLQLKSRVHLSYEPKGEGEVVDCLVEDSEDNI